MPGAPEPHPSEPAAAGPYTSDLDGCARRVVVDPDGPVLVEGPVEVVRPDGSIARSDRFVVALCTCRRTRTPPWCDTSHRTRRRRHRADQDRHPVGGDAGRTDEGGPAGDRD